MKKRQETNTMAQWERSWQEHWRKIQPTHYFATVIKINWKNMVF